VHPGLILTAPMLGVSLAVSLNFVCNLFLWPAVVDGEGLSIRCGCWTVDASAGKLMLSRGARGATEGMGCAPCGPGPDLRRMRTSGFRVFFGSGSGAQVEIGRWSDGSTTLPIWSIIGPCISIVEVDITVGDANLEVSAGVV